MNAAFFMGLLFLLAGYFVPQSYDRKGSGIFLKGRWQRIGIPLVTLALFVHSPLVYLADEESSSSGEFMGNAYANGLQEVYIRLFGNERGRWVATFSLFNLNPRALSHNPSPFQGGQASLRARGITRSQRPLSPVAPTRSRRLVGCALSPYFVAGAPQLSPLKGG